MAFLFIDGHSLIHAAEPFRTMHRSGGVDGRRQARLYLTSLARRYADGSGERLVLVFDGTGAKTREESREDGLQVIYAGGGKTADDVIERLAAKYAPTTSVSVVTEDVAERITVAAFGATWMSAKSFAERIERLEASRSKKPSAPQESFNAIQWPGSSS